MFEPAALTQIGEAGLFAVAGFDVAIQLGKTDNHDVEFSSQALQHAGSGGDLLFAVDSVVICVKLRREGRAVTE